MIFDEIVRTDSGFMGQSESAFRFMNKSARDETTRIRELLETWFSHIAATDQASLRGDFRSGNDVQFASAFFELYVHELLRLLDHEIEIHPSLPGTSKRPDFRATLGDHSLVLECRVVLEESVAEQGDNKRLAEVADSLRQIQSDEFRVVLEGIGVPQSSVPTGRWKGNVQKWLAQLSRSSLLKEGSEQLHLAHHGFNLLVEARALEVKKMGSIVAYQAFGEGEMVTSHVAIRNAILEKAGKYGLLDVPYIIVVNGIGDSVDEEEFLMALFGQDGIWHDTSRNTRVSGIIAFARLGPRTIPTCRPILFLNPDAKLEYSGPLTTALTSCRFDGSKPVFVPGLSPTQIFELPIDWPSTESNGCSIAIFRPTLLLESAA